MSKIQGLSTGLPDSVDLDQLEIEILIICKNPAAFQHSATFLSKRGWPTTVVGNLSKAVDIILKKPPDIILISINHQNPGSQLLPSVLGDSGQTICVAFAELSDATTSARLQSSPIHFKLTGTSSGPNIHRMILRILKELYPPENKIQESSEAQLEDASQDSDNRHHGQDAKDSQIQSSSRTESEEDSLDAGGYRMARKRERQKLRKIRAEVEGWDLNDSNSQSKLSRKALLDLVSEKGGRGESGMMFLPTKGDQDDSKTEKGLRSAAQLTQKDSQLASVHSEAHGKIPSTIQSGPKATSSGPIIQQGAKSTTEHNIVQEGVTGKSHSAVQKGPDGKSFSVVQGGPEDGETKVKSSELDPRGSSVKASSGFHPQQAASIDSPEIVGPNQEVSGLNEISENSGSDHNKNPTVGRPTRLKTDVSSEGTPESLKPIDQAMEDALSNLGQKGLKGITPNPKTSFNTLGTVDLVCTIPFEGETFNGYVVLAASGIDEKNTDQFFKSFLEEFSSSLQRQGVKAKLLEGFLLSVDQFSFTEWANYEATLAFQLKFENVDVGVSFLATEFPVPQPELNSKGEMAKIKLRDIDLEQPVTFKTYLYFKSSNRYFLYLRNGRKLLASQKEHLVSQNVNDLYIKSVDSKNFNSYQAALIIGRSTKSYRSRKAG